MAVRRMAIMTITTTTQHLAITPHPLQALVGRVCPRQVQLTYLDHRQVDPTQPKLDNTQSQATTTHSQVDPTQVDPIWDRQSMSRTSESYKKTELLHCLHEGCEYQTKRQYDYDRHQKTHYPSQPSEKFDCTIRGCDRTGERAFSRKDNLKEHLRTVHAKVIPKQGRRRSKHESKPDSRLG